MVSETTETSITWTWNVSEGALGYAVQVSFDEMFDDTDQIGLTLETSFTVPSLTPNTSAFLRVRAGTGTPEALAAAVATGSLEGLVLSDWTTHVTGMSNMPPPEPEPEPEPMAPVMVEFSLSADAADANFMIALDGGDKETAMAMVNPEIMVKSNTTAVITPMWVEDAAGVAIMAVDTNMPFAYVDWQRLQADVVSAGATFMIQRTTVGANQEMEPTGDVEHVTCGPFACADGMDVPEITLDNSTCGMWQESVSLELDVGLIDNDQLSHLAVDGVEATEDAPDDVRIFDGLDLGWLYTSSAATTVTHDLAVTSMESKGVAKASSRTALGVGSFGRVRAADSAGAGADYFAIGAHVDTFDDDSLEDDGDLGACQPLEGRELNDTEGVANLGSVSFGYNDNVASRVHRPDNCFRITADDTLKRDYLAPYSVTMDAGIIPSWGAFVFEDLTCDAMSYEASAQVDVCALFEDEVDGLNKEPTTKAVVHNPAEGTDSTSTRTLIDNTLAGFQLVFYDQGEDAVAAVTANRRQFTAMWYVTDAKKKTMNDLHRDYPSTEPDVEGDGAVPDGTNQFGDDPNEQGIVWKDGTWVSILDADFDPMYGDLGKVDAAGGTADGNADNIRTDDDTYACSDKDGGSKATSSLCDARDVEIATSVTFVDGMGMGCSVTMDYTLTCQWDASGNLDGSLGGHDTDGIEDDGMDLGEYVSCKVE